MCCVYKIQKGGLIRVGGDFHGANTSVPNAKTTAIDSASTLKADGGTGQVVVWSDQQTDYYGSISADKAGSIEVSSKGLLNYAGAASAGVGGSLLLDPKNIIIDSSTATSNVGNISFAQNTGTNITVAINSQSLNSTAGCLLTTCNGLTSTLQSGTNVILQANKDTAKNNFPEPSQ